MLGSLIHDIGVYQCHFEVFNEISTHHYVEHGELGMKLALDNGIDYKLARFCEFHTGVGITIKDIEKDNLPIERKNYIAMTIEEDNVMYSDKFHSKFPRFNEYEDIEKGLMKFGIEKQAILNLYRIKFGIPDLTKIKNKYKSWEVEFNRFLDSIK